MLNKKIYDRYFAALVSGNRVLCTTLVQDLLDQGIEVRELYRDLFEASLYEIGGLWEQNRLSVAREHLATAITENLLCLVYPFLFKRRRSARKAVISCAVNEYHQIGGKMVADLLEMNGWDSYFLGSNMPADQLMAFLHELEPDMVGLSLSVASNAPQLTTCVKAIRERFPDLTIVLGGQAFSGDGLPPFHHLGRVHVIRSLEELEAEDWYHDHESWGTVRL